VPHRAALAYWGVSIGSNTTVRAGSRRSLPLSRYTLAGASLVVVVVGVVAVLMSGGGHRAAVRGRRATAAIGSVGPAATHTTTPTTPTAVHRTRAGHLPRKGVGTPLQPTRSASATGGGSASAGVSSGKAIAVAEVRDPEEAKSFPEPASVHHRSATSPSVAAEAAVAPGAASDAQVRKELGEEEHAKAQEQAAQHRVLTPVAGGFSVGGNGTIPIPSGVPEAVQRVVAGGNAIADFPYIWGGGHASFIANGYDCSGSVSYALAAGGLLNAPLVSGDLASWGEPGPGKWITIYANAGHTFMDVDGIWFDTAGRSGPYASRWLVSTPPLAGYAVRHPPGL
jgi:cell wall-associated NlpC family hydrolase